MATLAEHRDALNLADTRYRRLLYAFQNFSDLLKAHRRVNDPDKRGGGRTFDGLHFLTEADLELLSLNLVQEDWTGLATAQTFNMAELAFNLMNADSPSFEDTWSFGRVLMSAFTLAEIYRLERLDDYGDAPYYVVEALENQEESLTPLKTRHSPFPKWKSNKDKFGNRLVSSSYPSRPELRYVPDIDPKLPWVKAVHALENTAFQINKEVLEWASQKKVQAKLVPSLPPDYKKNRAELDKGKPRIERLKKKVNKEKKNKGLSKTDLKFWNEWWSKDIALRKKRNKFQARRKQFKRQLLQAQTLADDGRPFYHRVRVDWRGRIYLPNFSYQGSDFCRAVIEFADAKVMTKEGGMELSRHCANMIGLNIDHDEKYQAGFDRISTEMFDFATDPLSAKSLNRAFDADKPFGYFRAAIEWRNLYASTMLGAHHAKMVGSNGFSKDIIEAMSDFVENNLERKTVRTKTIKDHFGNPKELYPAKDNKQMLSHLPIASDHRNSAFQHIGYLLNDEQGKDLIERCTTEDLYEVVAKKTNLPPKSSRKIVKIIMMPWSYGARKESCRDSVLEWRIENAGLIKYLDDLSYDEVVELVEHVFAVLHEEFPACLRFQRIVKDALKQARRTDRTMPVRWVTSQGFVVHQGIYKTKDADGYVWNGADRLVQLGAKIPTKEISWPKMYNSAPPSLVHSQDATVVHIMLGKSSSMKTKGGDFVSFGVDPMVTVHDSFSTLGFDAGPTLFALNQVTIGNYSALTLQNFVADVTRTARPVDDTKEWVQRPIKSSPYT